MARVENYLTGGNVCKFQYIYCEQSPNALEKRDQEVIVGASTFIIV